MSSLREQFEAWYVEKFLSGDQSGYMFIRSNHNADLYMYHGVQDFWQAFQAGHAASGRDDLLEACEALLKIGNESEPFSDAGMWEHKLKRREIEDNARAAIEKARGE